MDDLIEFVEALARDDVVQKAALRDGRGDFVAVGSNQAMPAEELGAYLYREPFKDATARIHARIARDFAGG